MKGISPKPVDKDNIVDTLNKEIIPLLREMRRFFSDAGTFSLVYVPENYARVVLPGRRIWHLVAHLKGLDDELGDLRVEVENLKARVTALEPP